MSKNVVWYCKTDKSWGVCAEDDLVVIREDDMMDGDMEILCSSDASDWLKRFVIKYAYKHRHTEAAS